MGFWRALRFGRMMRRSDGRRVAVTSAALLLGIGCQNDDHAPQPEPTQTVAAPVVEPRLGDTEATEAWDAIRRAMCECWIETSADLKAEAVAGPLAEHQGSSFGHGRRTISLDPARDAEAWEPTQAFGQLPHDPLEFGAGTQLMHQCGQSGSGAPESQQCDCPEAYPHPFHGAHHPERAWARTDPDAIKLASQLLESGRPADFAQICSDVPNDETLQPILKDSGCSIVAPMCAEPVFARGTWIDPNDLNPNNPVEYQANEIRCNSPITWVSHDFCYADFNYCVGLKLLTRARSIASPPRTTGTRFELLQHATIHLGQAVAEYSGGLQAEPPAFALAWPVFIGPPNPPDTPEYDPYWQTANEATWRDVWPLYATGANLTNHLAVYPVSEYAQHRPAFKAAAARFAAAESWLRRSAAWSTDDALALSDMVNPSLEGTKAAQQLSWGTQSFRAAALSAVVGSGTDYGTPPFPIERSAKILADRQAREYVRQARMPLVQRCLDYEGSSYFEYLSTPSSDPHKELAKYLGIPESELTTKLPTVLGFTLSDFDEALGAFIQELNSLPLSVSIIESQYQGSGECFTVRLQQNSEPLAHDVTTWRPWLEHGYPSDLSLFPFPYDAATIDTSPPLSGPCWTQSEHEWYGQHPGIDMTWFTAGRYKFLTGSAGATLFEFFPSSIETFPLAVALRPAVSASRRGVWQIENLAARAVERMRGAQSIPWKQDVEPHATAVLNSAVAYAGLTWSETYWRRPPDPAGDPSANKLIYQLIGHQSQPYTIPTGITIGIGAEGRDCLQFGRARTGAPCGDVLKSVPALVDEDILAHPTATESVFYTQVWPQHQVFAITLTDAEIGRAKEYSRPTELPLLYVAFPVLAGGTFSYSIIDVIVVDRVDQVHPVKWGELEVPSTTVKLTDRSRIQPVESPRANLGFGRDFTPPLENPFDSNDTPLSSFETYLAAADGASALALSAWVEAYNFENGKTWDGNTTPLAEVRRVCGSDYCPPISRLDGSTTVGTQKLYIDPTLLGGTGCAATFDLARSQPASVLASAVTLQNFFSCMTRVLAENVNGQRISPWSQIVADAVASGGSHAIINSECGGELRETLIDMEDGAAGLQRDGQALLVLTKAAALIVTYQQALAPECKEPKWLWENMIKDLVEWVVAVATSKNEYEAYGKAGVAVVSFTVKLLQEAYKSPSTSCTSAKLALAKGLVESWAQFTRDYYGVTTSTMQHLNTLLDGSRDLARELGVIRRTTSSLSIAQPNALALPSQDG